MTKETIIKLYMAKLHISYEEAEQLYLDDENDVSVDLTADQKKAVKEMTQADRKVETAPRKRERKVDENKRFLIDRIYDGVRACAETLTIINPEREIELTYEDEKYRIVLMKPRKEKKE